MIKCNHPQFGNDNKSRLEDLFRFLLQYIHDCACLGKILYNLGINKLFSSEHGFKKKKKEKNYI